MKNKVKYRDIEIDHGAVYNARICLTGTKVALEAIVVDLWVPLVKYFIRFHVEISISYFDLRGLSLLIRF